MDKPDRVLPALLRHWRGRRGLSQLALGLRADVSARHISFLETGRSRPSREMVLRLADVLAVSADERDVMLREAGFAPASDGRAADALADPEVARALDAALRYHEPFPMLVLDRAYDVLRANGAARRLVERCAGAGGGPWVDGPWNAMEALFDPALLRPFMVDWEATARTAVGRVHRDALKEGPGGRASALLDRLLAAPGVPAAWREPDLTQGSEATLPFRLRAGEDVLSFVGTLSALQAPQNAALGELLVGSYLPADGATEQACVALAKVDSIGSPFPRGLQPNDDPRRRGEGPTGRRTQ